MGTKIYSVLHRYVCLATLVVALFLPSLSVTVNAACGELTNVSVVNATPTSATLQWTVDGTGRHDYDIRVSTQQLSTSALPSATVGTAGVVVCLNAQTLADVNYSLTGLDGGVHYYVYIRQNCEWDYDGTSSWKSCDFYTPCAATNVLPVSAGFDGATTLPSCWYASGVTPVVQSSVRFGASGNAVKLAATAADGSYLYSPVFSYDAHAYLFSAKVYGRADAHYVIGVAPASDLQMVEPIVNGTIAVTNQWDSIDAVIPDEIRQEVEQGTEYVWVIYCPSSDNASPVYFDNILIEELPTCVSPSELTASNVADVSLTLSWMERGSATAWVVEYASATETLTVNASTNPFTLTGLEPNTYYTLRVKAVCSATEQSAWSAPLRVKTSCGAFAMPFAENFDGVSTGVATATTRPSTTPAYPECWEVLNETGSSSGYPQAFLTSNGGYNVSGNSFFVKMSSTTPLVLVLPEMDAAPGADIAVGFYYRNEGVSASNGNVQLGYVTNAADASSFVQLAEYARTTTLTSVEEYVSLPANARIAFRFKGGTSDNYYASIDNVVVKPAPTCMKPKNLRLASASVSSAVLSWTAGGNETSWKLTYKLNQDEIQTIVVNNTPEYTISGLEANTAYALSQLSLQAICSATDSSEVVTFGNIAFRTPCDVVSLPFTNGFNTDPFPGDCWTGSYHLAGGDGGWSRETSASNVFSGAGSAKLADAQLGNRNVIATPFFHSEAPNTLRVSFWMKRTSSYNTKQEEGVRVWVNTTATDTLGGTPLIHVARVFSVGGTGIKVPAEAAEGWYKYTATIPVAGDVCLLFEGISEYGTASYIDEVIVEAIPTCENSVQAINVEPAAQDVTVSWIPNGASQWELAYQFETEELQTVVVSDSTYTITGLQAATPYTFEELAIRTICEVGDTSNWISFAGKQFVTKCVPITLPLTEDFDSLTSAMGIPDCWDRSETTVTTASNNWGYYETGRTGHGLRFNSYIVSSGQYGALKTPLFEVTSPRSVEVKFAYKNPTGGDFSVYVSRDGGATYPEALATGLTNQTTWKEVSYVFSANPGELLCVVFKAISNYGNGDAYVYLDDVHVEAPLCGKITGFNVQSVTENAATITWTPTAAVSYDAVLFDSNMTTVDPSAAIRTVSATAEASATFTDLEPNHVYYAFVKGNCEGEDSEWSNVFSFRTDCAARTIPFVESFEPDGAELCWKTVGNAVELSTTTSAFDGAKAAMVVNDSVAGLLVSPRFDVTSLAEYEVGLAINLANVQYHGALKPLTIGVMTDPNDVSTYIDLGDIVIPSAGSWKEYRFSFADLATPDYADWAGAQYIVVSMSDSATYYFDAITVAIPAECPKPTALDIQPNAEDVVVDWVSDATAHYAEIALGDNVVFAGNVQKPFIPVGLEGNTLYKVRVRAICGADNSEWTPWTSFKTPCSYALIPFSEDFEDYTAATFPDCWNQKQIAEGTGYGTDYADRCFVVNTTTGSSYIHNGTKSLKLQTSRNGTHTLLALPMFNSSHEGDLMLSFWMYRTTGTSKLDEGVRVWVNNIPSLDGATALMHVTRCGGVAADSLKVAPITTAGWYQYEKVLPISGPCYVILEGISEYGSTCYLDDIQVIETPSCPRPSGLHVETVEEESALLVWDPAGSETAWELIYKLNNGSADTIVVNDVPSFELQNLRPATSYTLKVLSLRALCSAEDSSESITATLDIKTPCVAVMTLPLEEDFADGINDCWARYSLTFEDGVSTATATPTTSGWNRNTNVFTEGGVKLNIYGESCKSWLVTPVFQVVDPQTAMSFDFALTDYGNANPIENMGSQADDKFIVAVSTDGSTWNMANATVWSNEAGAEHVYDNIATTGETYVLPLGAYAGQNIRIAFYGESTQSGGDNDLHLSNIYVGAPASCERPARVEVSNITSASASISIKDPAGSAWEYVLDNENATPIAVADSNFVLTGLTQLTEYTIYVRRVCGAGDVSTWRSTTFVTDADCSAPLTVPFVESFENMPTGSSTSAGPLCWDMLNTNDGSYPYAYVNTNSSYVNTGSKSLYFVFSASIYAYAVLPAFEVATSQLRLKFACKFENVNYSGKLYVGYMTDPASAASFVQLREVTRSTSWQTIMVEMGAAPADARIAFKYGGASDNYYLGIDDIEITMLPLDETINSIAATNVKRVSADLNWTPAGFNTCNEYQLVLSTEALADSALAVAEFITLDTTYYHANDLLRDATYYAYVRTGCSLGNGFGKWVSTSFKTKSLSDVCEDINIAEGGYMAQVTPVIGYYADEPQHVQSIYPDTMLTAIVGDTISQLHYTVLQGSNLGSWDDVVFTVRMGVTAQDELPGFVSTGLTQVYSGTLSADIYDDMVVNLTTPFVYNGGNLLIDFESTIGSSYSEVYFAGAAAGASRILYWGYDEYDDYAPIEATLSFVPQLTFTKCASAELCPTVRSAEATLLGLGTSEAMLTWRASEADYANTYEVYIGTSNELEAENVVPQYVGIDSLSLHVAGLNEGTQYYAYIRVVCDAFGHDEGSSEWFVLPFTTNANCMPIVDLVATVTGKHTAVAAWSKSLEDQDNSFLYILSENELDSATLATASAMPIDTVVLSLDNLLSGQIYHLYVAASCGTEHSTYVHTLFTMPDACIAVANLTAVRVSDGAATLSWTHGQYAEESLWEAGIVGDDSFTQVLADTSVVFFGLTENTTYVAYVKAICAEGDTSAVATTTFTTMSAADMACIVSGEGTSSDNTIPFNNYYRNAWNQIIYTADQIGRAGSITSISFNLAVAGTSTFTANHLTIYLANTDMEYAVTNDSWIPESDLVQVFTASNYVYPNAAGWVTFQFETPFEYNGGNLAVVTSQAAPEYSSAYKWRYSNKTSGITLYRSSDTDLTYAEYPTEEGSKRAYQADATFCFEAGDCLKPMSLKVSNITSSSADMSWYPGGSETAWEYVLGSAILSDAQLAVAEAVTVNNVKAHLTDLEPDQDYYFYVRSLCSDSTASNWAMIHFVSVPTCQAAASITVEDITSNTANISWVSLSEGTYLVAYGPAETFNLANPASYATIQATNLYATLPNLLANTSYVVSVRVICSATDESRWSEPVLFRTGCEPFGLPFAEDFEDYDTELLPTYATTPDADEVIVPTCWDFINNKVYTSTTTYPQAFLTANSSYVASGSNALFFKSSSTDPLIAMLPEFAISEPTVVRMAYSYRNESTYEDYNGSVEAIQIKANGEIRVLETPRLSSSILQVEIDGVTLEPGDRLAFRYKGGSSNYYASVDDIRVSRVVMAEPFTDGTCDGSDYIGYGFELADNQLHPGNNVFTRLQLATTDLEADTVFTLNLFVSQPSTQQFTDTVCAHEHYTGYGFDIAEVDPLRTSYQRTLTNMYGCDSTVILRLYVPQTEFEVTEHLCEGQTYLFGDSVISTSGVYVRNYQNIYGCDSTITLSIYFHATSAAIQATICQGEVYEFGGEPISAAGTYTHTFQNAAGCDSVVTLTLNVIEPVVTYINGVFCEGTTFAGGEISPEFIGLDQPGVYRDTLQSLVTGCDSILVLTLVEEMIEHTTVNGTYSEGRPFVFNGQSYQEAGTFEVVLTSVNGCDSIITLVITAASALDNVYGLSLNVAPNPAVVGQDVQILSDIAFAADYRLMVFDAVGKLVYVTDEQTLVVPGLPTAGFYTVRVHNSGQTYQAKLLVK